METKKNLKGTAARQQASLRETAARYAALAAEMKRLEALAAPLKNELTRYAQSVGVLALDLGAVMIERRTRTTAKVDQSRVTPDWLYRMQRDGYAPALKVTVDAKALEPGDARAEAYLGEVGYEERTTDTYAIRLNAAYNNEEGGAR